MVRIRPVRVTHVAGWPSGLRRQFKALVSSEARVRISLQSLFDANQRGGGKGVPPYPPYADRKICVIRESNPGHLVGNEVS